MCNIIGGHVQQVNNGNKFHGPCLKGVKNVKIKPPTPVLTISGHVQRVNNCNKFHGPCLRRVKNITRPPLCNMSRVGDEPHSPRTSDQKRNAHSRKTRMFKRPPGPLWASILVPLCASILGKRGTWRHRLSLCVAGMGLMALGWLWWRDWVPFGAVVARAVCVAGVALADIDVHFVWQVRHLLSSTLTLRGRCGIWWHRPSLCVAGVALMALGWLWWRRGRRGCFCGRRGTWRHPVSFTYRSVAHSSFTHNIVTHNSFTHINALTHNFLTHISLTTISHHLSGPCRFSFLPFPSHFHICLVIIGRSWHVWVSGPLIFFICHFLLLVVLKCSFFQSPYFSLFISPCFTIGSFWGGLKSGLW